MHQTAVQTCADERLGRETERNKYQADQAARDATHTRRLAATQRKFERHMEQRDAQG